MPSRFLGKWIFAGTGIEGGRKNNT